MEPISLNSAVNIGFLIVLIGATWRLAVLLTEIKRGLLDLADVPKQLRGVKQRVQAVEVDLNNLFAAVRTEDPTKLFEVMRIVPRSRVEDDE